jgi:hypothetical protein
MYFVKSIFTFANGAIPHTPGRGAAPQTLSARARRGGQGDGGGGVEVQPQQTRTQEKRKRNKKARTKEQTILQFSFLKPPHLLFLFYFYNLK